MYRSVFKQLCFTNVWYKRESSIWNSMRISRFRSIWGSSVLPIKSAREQQKVPRTATCTRSLRTRIPSHALLVRHGQICKLHTATQLQSPNRISVHRIAGAGACGRALPCITNNLAHPIPQVTGCPCPLHLCTQVCQHAVLNLYTSHWPRCCGLVIVAPCAMSKIQRSDECYALVQGARHQSG